MPKIAPPAQVPVDLPGLAEDMLKRCKLCKMCQKECRLLKEAGMPGEIAASFLEGKHDPKVAFQCTLCGLCTQVCPVKKLDPKAMFMAMREEAVADNPALIKPYRSQLAYERLGRSKPFRFVGLPEGAKRAFFPGCNVPGVLPDLVWEAYLKLREQDPTLGFVLGCCAKPSLMIGQRDRFEKYAGELCSMLVAAGVEELLLGCPNCFAALKELACSLKLRMVYDELAEVLPEVEAPDERPKYALHDPCVLRGEKAAHQGVRGLLWNSGCSVTEMRHAHHKAMCCGEGGGVAVAYPELANTWRDARIAEAKGKDLAVYCAGCLTRFDGHANVRHALDIALRGRDAEALAVVHAPKTYWNRLKLKRKAEKYFAK